MFKSHLTICMKLYPENQQRNISVRIELFLIILIISLILLIRQNMKLGQVQFAMVFPYITKKNMSKNLHTRKKLFAMEENNIVFHLYI